MIVNINVNHCSCVLVWAQIMRLQVFLTLLNHKGLILILFNIQKDKNSETLVFEWWLSED